MGSPPASESITLSNIGVEEREKGRKGEEEKNQQTPPSSLLPPPSHEDDDDDVSWQSAARASLEKPKPLHVKPVDTPVAKKAEPAPQKVAVKTEVPSTTQKTFSKSTTEQPVKPETPPLLPSSSSASLLVDTAPSQTSPVDLPEEQFTREELPGDFWSRDPEPPPSSYDNELFETATSAPTKNIQPRTSKATTKLPFDMPLFNELQAIFPGRIVRIDAKQQKQAEESEETPAPTNEAVSVIESEEEGDQEIR